MNRTPRFTFPEQYFSESAALIETALGSLGAYAAWKPFDPGPLHSIDARYNALPVLTKKEIREHFPYGFVKSQEIMEAGLTSKDIEIVTTSGTTDERVSNIWNQSWWDASERSSWLLNSHTAGVATGTHKEAILTSSLAVGTRSDDVLLPMEERMDGRFLFLNERVSPVLWTPPLYERMIRELDMFKPVVLEANPSYLAKLARYATETGTPVYQPPLIIITFEYPTLFQLRQIGRAFKSPLVSSHGSTETGYVFMQCEKGLFHQNTNFCRVDMEPFKEEHGGPLLGRILVTPFKNPWYTLLRFDIGDLGRIEASGTCPCGRNHGIVLSAIEGRWKCITLTTEGKLVTHRQLDFVLGGISGIAEYMLCQTESDTYVLQLVPETEQYTESFRAAEHALKSLYGKKARVFIQKDDFLVPELSGKYQLVKTSFPIHIEDYIEKDKQEHA